MQQLKLNSVILCREKQKLVIGPGIDGWGEGRKGKQQQQSSWNSNQQTLVARDWVNWNRWWPSQTTIKNLDSQVYVWVDTLLTFFNSHFSCPSSCRSVVPGSYSFMRKEKKKKKKTLLSISCRSRSNKKLPKMFLFIRKFLVSNTTPFLSSCLRGIFKQNTKS